MKKLLFILLFLSSSVYARGGPQYQHDKISPQLDAEINNIYEDMRQDLYNGGRISSATISSLTVTALNYTTLNPPITASTVSIWTSYTPTITGCGTVTLLAFWYKQVGDTIFVQGGFRVATPTAASVSISLPASFPLSSSKVNGNVFPYFGFSITQNNGASAATTIGQVNPISYDGSTTTAVFWGTNTGSGAFVKVNGSTLYSGSEWIAQKFEYPIN